MVTAGDKSVRNRWRELLVLSTESQCFNVIPVQVGRAVQHDDVVWAISGTSTGSALVKIKSKKVLGRAVNSESISLWSELRDGEVTDTVVILDFSEVEFVGTVFLGELVSQAMKRRRQGDALILCGLREECLAVFELPKIVVHWKLLFNYCDSVEEALSKAVSLEKNG